MRNNFGAKFIRNEILVAIILTLLCNSMASGLDGCVKNKRNDSKVIRIGFLSRYKSSKVSLKDAKN